MTLAWLLLQFGVCGALIGRAGWVLSVSGDRIATLTGLSRGWIGVALLATVTSLPELASGLSAVLLVGQPDLAVGNALGACAFNLVFLAVVDALQRRKPLYPHVSDEHLLSAAFGVVMLGVVALNLLLGAQAPALLHVGVSSPVLLALYLLALRSLHANPRRREAPPPHLPGPGPTLGQAMRRFGIAAAVVLAAGIWMPALAEDLVLASGWSRSLVGTLLMALVTTLPEVAVTLSALRLGAADMAVGNLLGSNLFNVVVLTVADAAYRPGVLLTDADAAHAATAVATIVMTGLVMVGLVVRPRQRVLRLATWVSAGLVATYLLAAALLMVRGD